MLRQTLNRFEAKFQYLDQVPESLYDTVVTHQHGTLALRCEGILQWRSYLLQGQLPEQNKLVWPEPDIALVVLKRLEALEIVKYCQEQEELADSILVDICEAISSVDEFNQIDPGFDDRLAQEQKQRDRDSPFEDPLSNKESNKEHNEEPSIESDEGTGEESIQDSGQDSNHYDNQEEFPALQDIYQDSMEDMGVESLANNQESNIEALSSQQNTKIEGSNPIESPEQKQGQFVVQEDEIDPAQQIDQYLESNWKQLAKNWDSLSAVYQELSAVLGRGWDLTQGLLATQGWKDIAEYQQHLKQLPRIKEIIATIGRCRETDAKEKSVSEEMTQTIQRLVEEEQFLRTPFAVMHTSGIKRSDDISRLLPSEAAYLGHPQLNLLWHARRAERTLLTYEIDGVMSQHEPIEKEELEKIEQDKQEKDNGYGPILICLDTSASMQGEVENMAKAITLEAFKIALSENRLCHLFLFSGPEQLIQYSLDMSKQGLSDLLEFIVQSFHGGTDVVGPLLTAFEKTEEQQWQKADILLISDGRFPVIESQKQKIQWARKDKECRIHAIQLGEWHGEGISELCDFIHYF